MINVELPGSGKITQMATQHLERREGTDTNDPRADVDWVEYWLSAATADQLGIPNVPPEGALVHRSAHVRMKKVN